MHIYREAFEKQKGIEQRIEARLIDYESQLQYLNPPLTSPIGFGLELGGAPQGWLAHPHRHQPKRRQMEEQIRIDSARELATSLLNGYVCLHQSMPNLQSKQSIEPTIDG